VTRFGAVRPGKGAPFGDGQREHIRKEAYACEENMAKKSYTVEGLKAAQEEILAELGKRIVGQTTAIQEVLTAFFAGGHCMITGMPGVAKTLLVSCLSEVMDLEFKRIQKEWKESYGGTEQRTAFIRGAQVEWQQTGLSQEDMQWLEGRQFSQEEIMKKK